MYYHIKTPLMKPAMNYHDEATAVCTISRLIKRSCIDVHVEDEFDGTVDHPDPDLAENMNEVSSNSFKTQVR